MGLFPSKPKTDDAANSAPERPDDAGQTGGPPASREDNQHSSLPPESGQHPYVSGPGWQDDDPQPGRNGTGWQDYPGDPRASGGRGGRPTDGTLVYDNVVTGDPSKVVIGHGNRGGGSTGGRVSGNRVSR